MYLDEAAGRMIEAAATVAGSWIRQVSAKMIHRWRYALVEGGITGRACLVTREGAPAAAFCGDAYEQAKIEGAYLSGLAAAEALLRE